MLFQVAFGKFELNKTLQWLLRIHTHVINFRLLKYIKAIILARVLSQLNHNIVISLVVNILANNLAIFHALVALLYLLFFGYLPQQVVVGVELLLTPGTHPIQMRLLVANIEPYQRVEQTFDIIVENRFNQLSFQLVPVDVLYLAASTQS